jgi:hypothetical protein
LLQLQQGKSRTKTILIQHGVAPIILSISDSWVNLLYLKTVVATSKPDLPEKQWWIT